MSFTLEQLNQRIVERSTSDAKNSYTAQLLAQGVPHCAKKFGEEAVEIIISATQKDKADIKNEAADVLYHLLVLLHASDVSLKGVMNELQDRSARSGIEEKASR